LPAEFPNEHIRPEIDEWDGDRLFAEVCSLVEAGVVAPSPGRALLTAPVKEDPFDDDDGTQRTLAFEGMCRALTPTSCTPGVSRPTVSNPPRSSGSAPDEQHRHIPSG
jgi:hypothetical protein